MNSFCIFYSLMSDFFKLKSSINTEAGSLSSMAKVHMACEPQVCNSYRMSARGAWIGTTSARGNVNSKRRQPRGVYIPRAEVIPIHAPRARIR